MKNFLLTLSIIILTFGLVACDGSMLVRDNKTKNDNTTDNTDGDNKPDPEDPSNPEVPPIEPPVDPTDPPIEPPIEPPVDPTDPPIEPPIEPPVDPTDPPIEPPIEPPVDPTDPPIEPPIEPPVDPTDPPIEPPIEPPVDPTDPYACIMLPDTNTTVNKPIKVYPLVNIIGKKAGYYAYQTAKRGEDTFANSVEFQIGTTGANNPVFPANDPRKGYVTQSGYNPQDEEMKTGYLALNTLPVSYTKNDKLNFDLMVWARHGASLDVFNFTNNNGPRPTVTIPLSTTLDTNKTYYAKIRYDVTPGAQYYQCRTKYDDPSSRIECYSFEDCDKRCDPNYSTEGPLYRSYSLKTTFECFVEKK